MSFFASKRKDYSYSNTNQLTPDMNFSNMLISDLKDHIANVLDQVPREHHNLPVDNVANLQLSKADLIKLLTEALKQRDAYFEKLKRRSAASREAPPHSLEDSVQRMHVEHPHSLNSPPPLSMISADPPPPLLPATMGNTETATHKTPESVTAPPRVTSRLPYPPNTTTTAPLSNRTSLSSMTNDLPPYNHVQQTLRTTTHSRDSLRPTTPSAAVTAHGLEGNYASIPPAQPTLPPAPVPTSAPVPPPYMDSNKQTDSKEKGKGPIDPRRVLSPSFARTFTRSAPLSSAAPLDDPNYPDILRRYLAQAEIGDTYSQVILGKAFLNGTGGVAVNPVAAMDWFQMAADQGVAEAQVQVGVILEEGLLLKKKGKGESSAKKGKAAEIPEEDLRRAADMYKRAADQGDTDGMTKLGRCYMNGWGVKKDEVKAAIWYKVAAHLGGPRAQNQLGWCYWKGKGVPKDWKEAVKWYKTSAAQQHPEGQINYGLSFLYGWDGVTDHIEAVKWLWLAAENNVQAACLELGVCIEKGNGVQKNPSVAVLWYKKAAEMGYARAQEKLGTYFMNGNYVEKDPVEGVKWLRMAAEQGYYPAQGRLGLAYQKGNGVEVDMVQAVQWFQKATLQGDLASQTNLAYCYQNGLGVPKDVAKAIYLYSSAAKANNAQAQCNLGFCYERGIGVPQNLLEADRLYKAAASKDHPRALTSLAGFIEQGIAGNPKNLTVALKMYGSAAKRGDAVSMFKLGRCYELGIGTEPELSLAAKWYTRAARERHPYAMANLGHMLLYGAAGVPPDPTEALHLLRASAELGNVKAMQLLAKAYEAGVVSYGPDSQPAARILDPDVTKARYWAEHAVKYSQQEKAVEAIIAACAAKGVPVPDTTQIPRRRWIGKQFFQNGKVDLHPLVHWSDHIDKLTLSEIVQILTQRGATVKLGDPSSAFWPSTVFPGFAIWSWSHESSGGIPPCFPRSEYSTKPVSTSLPTPTASPSTSPTSTSILSERASKERHQESNSNDSQETRDWLHGLLISTHPLHGCKPLPPGIGKWMASYIAAEHDSKRVILTRSELISMRWYGGPIYKPEKHSDVGFKADGIWEGGPTMDWWRLRSDGRPQIVRVVNLFFLSPTNIEGLELSTSVERLPARIRLGF
ncbi:hypothetical protein HDV05_000737 [Chytridiales sp. JEL 0842]|nr:hypothetical protein HDV05_000737 [Chytridiales sp. JEL 0842]